MKRKTAKTKVVAPARPKKHTPKAKARARWHEEAVIHQDVFFAEAPTQS
jgi:hypothetical protein